MTDTAVLQSSSRHRLLRVAAAWAIAHTVAGVAPLRASAPRHAKLFAYVGTYTGAAGSGSRRSFNIGPESGKILHFWSVGRQSDCNLDFG